MTEHQRWLAEQMRAATPEEMRTPSPAEMRGMTPEEMGRHYGSRMQNAFPLGREVAVNTDVPKRSPRWLRALRRWWRMG